MTFHSRLREGGLTMQFERLTSSVLWPTNCHSFSWIVEQPV